MRSAEHQNCPSRRPGPRPGPSADRCRCRPPSPSRRCPLRRRPRARPLRRCCSSRSPRAKQDLDPFVGQRPQGGMMIVAAAPLLVVVRARAQCRKVFTDPARGLPWEGLDPASAHQRPWSEQTTCYRVAGGRTPSSASRARPARLVSSAANPLAAAEALARCQSEYVVARSNSCGKGPTSAARLA